MPKKTKVKVQIAKKIKNIKKQKVQKQKQTVSQKVSINIPKELAKQGYSSYPIPPKVSYEPLPITNYLQQLVSNPIQRRLEIDELKQNVKNIEDNINKKLNQIELNRRVYQDKLDDRLKFFEDDIVSSQYESELERPSIQGVGLQTPKKEKKDIPVSPFSPEMTPSFSKFGVSPFSPEMTPSFSKFKVEQEYPKYRRPKIGSLGSESSYGIGFDIEPEFEEKKDIPVFLQTEKGFSLARKPEESREVGDYYRISDFYKMIPTTESVHSLTSLLSEGTQKVLLEGL